MKFSFLMLITILVTSSSVLGQTKNDSTEQYIKLESGETIYGKTEIKKARFSKKTKIMFQEKQEYKLSQVHSLLTEDGYYRKTPSAIFLPNGELLKRTAQGNIDLFSSWVYSHTNNANEFGSISYSSRYTETHFSKQGGALLRVNYKNLMKNLNDNQESIQHLKRYQTLQYTKLGLGLAGTAIIFVSAKKLNKEQEFTSSIQIGLITGVIVSHLGWNTNLFQGDRLRKAIHAYNTN